MLGIAAGLVVVTTIMWRTPLAWLQPVPVIGASPASRVLLSSNRSILCPSIFQYLQYSGLHLRGIQISAHRPVYNILFLPGQRHCDHA